MRALHCIGDWVYCLDGYGFQHEMGNPSRRKRHFKKNSVGQIRHIDDACISVWLIGTNETWDVNIDTVKVIDVLKTGDKFQHKIMQCLPLFTVRGGICKKSKQFTWYCT